MPHALQCEGQQRCGWSRHYLLPRLPRPVDADRRNVVADRARPQRHACATRLSRWALLDVLGE
eukprot:4350991-Pleurochrysis_carterae.AAC.1